MRYTSRTDATMMRRASADPSRYVRRMGVPQGTGSRTTFSGFGALTSIGSGSTAGSAAAGASTGAAIGSAVPVIGTAIGALVGGAVGAIMSAFNRQDKENLNFQQAQNMANQLGANAVLDINNKYLVLAGLFDLQPSQIKGNIPIYKKYGRMGEFKFVSDMCAVVQSAANAGVITANDTPQSVYSKVVLPWINSFGFGAMSDANANMITMIIIGMIAEYCANIYTQRWYAVGGQMPFGSLQPFSLPQASQAAQPQTTGGPTPSPQATQVVSELQNYQNGATPESGATVHYVRDANGQWLQLPQAAVFKGIDPNNRAWLVSIGGTVYEAQNGTLMDQTPPATQTQQATPVATSDTTSSLVTATDQSGQSVPAQYIPNSSGGGGYYPTPASPAAYSASVPSAGLSTTEIGIGAAVLLGLVYMMTQSHGGARK